jgi:radical SAM superfamily enzyme
MFLEDHVTPRFPDGLTVLTGRGQFRNSSEVIQREPSKLVIILYPPDQENAHKRIEKIREEYKTAFQQESVLRADTTACVSF